MKDIYKANYITNSKYVHWWDVYCASLLIGLGIVMAEDIKEWITFNGADPNSNWIRYKNEK